MIQVVQLLLSLSILVVLHEFGHYLAAKIFGCRVEKFYLFMDWKFALFKKRVGETEFGLGWLPLGGYVKISGMIDESLDAEGIESPPEPWELRAKPAWQRLIVMLGGIVVNILLAWFIYSMILFCWGESYTPIKSLNHGFMFNEGGELLGFQDGDQLVAVDGVDLIEYDPMMIVSSILFEGAKEVELFRNDRPFSLKINPDSVKSVIKNIQNYDGNLISPNYVWTIDVIDEGSVFEGLSIVEGDRILGVDTIQTIFYKSIVGDYLKSNVGKEIVVFIEKSGGSRFPVKDKEVGHVLDIYNNTHKEYPSEYFYVEEVRVVVPEGGLLGFRFRKNYIKTRSYTFLNSIPAGLTKTNNMVKMYWGQMKTIFNPSTGGYKHVGGVISIGKMFPGEWNWFAFWSMTALLSIILAIMNLLPIPALDGGHALIAFGEMITGKKLPLKVLMPLQVLGMVILFALLIYANGMDVVRLFN